MSFDVCVVGSCMTDLVSYTNRFPKPGETLHGEKFAIGFGGKGANQCVTAAKLGGNVAMVGKLGDDVFGQNYLKNFEDNRIDTKFVGVTKEAGTGVASILVNSDGQNSIIIVAGANLKLTEDDVKDAEEIIKNSKVVLCQLEISSAATLCALKLAKRNGVCTVFNPAPAQKELPEEIFSFCDIFCPNETEAEILTGLPVGNVEEAKQASKVLLQKGCACVIMTLGGQGSVVARNDLEPVHVPAEKVTPVDSTGAGDSFVGTLGYFLATKPELDILEMVRRSTVVAGISVQHQGTQTSFPLKKDLPPELFC